MRRVVAVSLSVLLAVTGCASKPTTAPPARSAHPSTGGAELPAAGEVVRRVPVMHQPDGLSATPTSLWVGSYGSAAVAQIDTRTGTLARTVQLSGMPIPLSVHADSTGVWAAAYGASAVLRIDPVTGRPDATIPVGSGPNGFAEVAGQLWVVNHYDSTISVINPGTRKVVRTIAVDGLQGGFPVAYGGAVWVADLEGSSNQLWRIDPASGRVTAKIPAGPNPAEVAFGFGSGWVTDREGLTRFDPASGAVQKRFTNLGRHLFGIAVTTGSVWVGSVDDNQLVRIDPQSGEMTGRVTDIKGPRQIAAVDGQLWVTEFNGNTVAQIKPAN
ncbi:YncE family protein [Micromonospora sp. RTP1Z1]|uniref:Vgb family protein n=1 Tax=Micromonospora sp. RTP1Z1 TaxID=2994043 RepID=UPI0029C87FC1|nr:YncE family protein [Micromonospora sp. RTP1Z1]